MELFDALTAAPLIDPVIAEDGHAYGRRSIIEYIAKLQDRGEALVSPQDMQTPMGEKLKPPPAPQRVDATEN